MLIQHFVPPNIDTCLESKLYYENVLVWICGSFALAGLASVLSLIPTEIGHRRYPATYQTVVEQQQQVKDDEASLL